MKNALSVLLLFLAFGASLHAETISLNVSSPVMPGSSFDVQVLVSDVFTGRTPGDLVEGFGFNVVVGNSAIVSYSGETIGSLFLDLSGFPGGPTVAGVALNPAGIGPLDFSAPLTLATLHFEALSGGTASIGVTWDSLDPNQGLIYASLPYAAISAETQVTAAAAVPEPGSLTLLVSGLGIAFIAARKSSRSKRRT